MARPLSRCTPEEAKAVLDSLPPRATLRELHRALVARGTPVSPKSLHNWRKSKWQCKGSAKVLQTGLLREARQAAERAGLPTDVIRDLEAKLTAMTDGDLVISVTRRLLIGAGLLLEYANAMAPELMRSDPRGLAALYIAASRMTKGAHASMMEARNLAERAMREKLLLLLQDFPRYADRDGDRSVTNRSPNANRALSDRQPFADLLERFSGRTLN